MRRAAQRAFALQFIRDIREKDPGIGGVKLWYMYQRDFEGNDKKIPVVEISVEPQRHSEEEALRYNAEFKAV